MVRRSFCASYFSGRLLDFERVPVLSLMVAFGTLIAVFNFKDLAGATTARADRGMAGACSLAEKPGGISSSWSVFPANSICIGWKARSSSSR